MRGVKKKFVIICLGIMFTAFYCEFLIYYIVAAQCSWPSIENTDSETPLKAFILADTHLLGPRKGHWLDKWRREWQMHQAYMAILTIHKPDVIFVLGDLFDEGEWSNSKQFKTYVNRFHEVFPIPDSNTVMHVVAGNHDIGFHHFIIKDHFKRFVKMLNSSLVELISIKENHFVLVNSMAMEGDRCNMCVQARNDIDKIAEILKCSEKQEHCDESIRKINYSRPILMQHFPLYRLSDAVCTGHDAPPLPERNKPFRPKWESLSQDATNLLAQKIKPRVVFGGHTHHGCLLHHIYTNPEHFEFDEHSVPSFSWRNRHNPKYMLMSVTPNNYSVVKCDLPQETTIVICAVMMVFMVILQAIKQRRI